MSDGTDVKAKMLEVMPIECWQLVWEMLQKVPVSGDAVDHAAKARAVVRELCASRDPSVRTR